MGGIESALCGMGSLGDLAARDTPVHRLDPRAKVLTTAAFIVIVVTHDRYAVAALTPFLLYPVAMIAVGGLPVWPIVKRLLLAAPFALCIALFNPLIDRTPMLRFGSVVVTGGWVSFASIMLRFVLTVSAALVLVATTGLESICRALVWFRAPRVFVTQLLFLHRYIFVLMDQVARAVRAHALRSPDGGRMRLRTFGSLVGHLLLRTVDRAQRIHQAMLCRGFDGEFRQLRGLHARAADVAFVLAWAAFFALARTGDLPHRMGSLLTGAAR